MNTIEECRNSKSQEQQTLSMDKENKNDNHNIYLPAKYEDRRAAYLALRQSGKKKVRK